MSQPATPPPTPFRAMREGAGITMRELARRTRINSGRLSIIERGVTPTDDERRLLLAELGRLLTGQTKGTEGA